MSAHFGAAHRVSFVLARKMGRRAVEPRGGGEGPRETEIPYLHFRVFMGLKSQQQLSVDSKNKPIFANRFR